MPRTICWPFFDVAKSISSLAVLGLAGLCAQAYAAHGDDDRIEGFDPIYRRAFAFHAFDAKIIGPGQRHLAGAEQLRGQAVAAPP